MTTLLVKSILIVAALLLALSAVSFAHAYTCEQVRAWHQQYGTAQLLRFARLYGVTAVQKRAAIQCIVRQRYARTSQ